jgi:hypothetical protein
VVQKGGARLKGVGHIDAIARPAQHLRLKLGLDPHVLGFVEGMAIAQLFFVQGGGDRGSGRVVAQGFSVLGMEQLRHPLS